MHGTVNVKLNILVSVLCDKEFVFLWLLNVKCLLEDSAADGAKSSVMQIIQISYFFFLI